MAQLAMLQYWKLTKNSKIIEIRERLAIVFTDQISPPILLSKPQDIHAIAARIYGLEKLPFQRKLEEYFQQDLDWIRIRFGEKEALRYLGQDWFVHGECILFATQDPSFEIVTKAVSSVIMRRIHLEK